ncbi:conserved hypothetical protein [Myxococcus xanthus DK 1622]|uniref:Uncharacterized protein n=1 Tax=Myxococcus xanthus (strain DK1622) TaxID=246197 RepID=Q1DE95_MYXXD|nr:MULTISPECIES: hypothetical protein [Myxococcus]ABF90984.1 conserved hypothetical protein [Myxococcus xanthus DK 1622]NOJ53572.1 hypothetical protein [Myxococcus xanthus]QDE88114.1 hypothetical protein BHS06_03620 [Myxococcus xanthus]QPM80439.1 hypothetical protein I5Q59_03830 [Myxococcus xanthus]QVW69501.1 hypothetical protein JTM82_08120 [Myxococcus xanthus DZ2]
MKEPFWTLYLTLTVHGHPPDIWYYNVKLRNEAIYIGTNEHHITVLANHGGWHVTINQSHDGQVAGGFDDLVNLRWDVTPEIGRALEWIRHHRVNM